MFRKMRRIERQLPEPETLAILTSATSGVLALGGDDNYPYAVPLSFLYDGGSLYFHGAVTGHKFDAVSKNEKASFCVVGRDQVVPEKMGVLYRSVICFGRIKLVQDNDEKSGVIAKFLTKYAGEYAKKAAGGGPPLDMVAIYRLDIEHMTGKAMDKFD